MIPTKQIKLKINLDVINENEYLLDDDYEAIFTNITKNTRAILGVFESWEISVVLVDNKTQQALNQKFRKKTYVADVLSFPIKLTDDIKSLLKVNILGDVVIAFAQAKKQAIEKHRSFKQEMTFLYIHGLLHILGYDHHTDYDHNIMSSLEKFILKSVNI